MKLVLMFILFVTGCSMVEPHGCSIGYKVGSEDGCVDGKTLDIKK